MKSTKGKRPNQLIIHIYHQQQHECSRINGTNAGSEPVTSATESPVVVPRMPAAVSMEGPVPNLTKFLQASLARSSSMNLFPAYARQYVPFFPMVLLPLGYACTHHKPLDTPPPVQFNASADMYASEPSTAKEDERMKACVVKKKRKIHTCNQCGKTYSAGNSLKYHTRKHAQIRFDCGFPGCTETFSAKSSLVRYRLRFKHPTTETKSCQE